MRFSWFSILSLMIVIGTSLQGCKKEYMKFDEDLSSVRFVYNQAQQGRVTYSFAMHPGKNRDTLEIPVQIIGFTAPFAREIALAAVPDKTTGQTSTHFELVGGFVPENSTTGKVHIVVLRSDDLDDREVVITIQLAENEYFSEAPVNESTYEIVLSNQLSRPADWPSEFGVYSRVKHEFVIEAIGIGADYEALNAQQLIYYVGLLNNVLYEYNKANPGNPLTDENDLIVTF